MRFLLWLKADIEKLIALENGGTKCLLALPGGRTVFTLPECVRAGVGMTGQSWPHHDGVQCEFTQADSTVVYGGLGVGRSCAEAKGQ